jgi:hypothetical protein
MLAATETRLHWGAAVGNVWHMKATLDAVTKEALALPANDKAILAEKIVSSLIARVSPAVKRQQLAEVVRRREEVLSGKVPGISLAEAMREIQALLA